MIRIRHESLPAGLCAVVRRPPGGDTDIVVSASLSPARQRAAVREGLRAARQDRRRAALPIPLLGVLALGLAWIRAFGRALRVHPAALAAATGVVAAAAVVIAVIPGQHGPAPGGHQPGAAGVPAPVQTAGRPGHGTRPAAGPPRTGRPSPGVVPIAAVSPASSPRAVPARSHGRSAPSPAASGGAPSPSPAGPPSPAPSPTTGGGGHRCLDLLGIWVCL